MGLTLNAMGEHHAEAAFSAQAPIFDETYARNTIVNYKRYRVRKHLLRYLKNDSQILELNAGTGEDAIFFARRGHQVHATDLSTGMQQQLRTKVQQAGLSKNVSTEICSFSNLDNLQARGPYDAVFSNFGGLNCTNQLDQVLASLPALLKPEGTATLVIITPFCLWETLLIFKGKFATATRRFFSAKGRKAHIEGEYFKCWYYHPNYVIKHARQNFEVLSIEGLCTIVPPSYIEGFAEKYPKSYRRLRKWENQLKSLRPWRNIGDYSIITLKRK